MPFNQRLSREIEPDDPAWRSAAPAERLAFFRAAGAEAIAIKRAELARAIGADGRRMEPRRRPRRDGADGPVLTPHRELSRTARLMAAHADAGGMTLFWRAGISRAQRTPWGTILGFHAAGRVRGAPIRDVRLSPAGIAELERRMAAWWGRRPARAAATPAPPRPGILGRIGRAIAGGLRGLRNLLGGR